MFNRSLLPFIAAMLLGAMVRLLLSRRRSAVLPPRDPADALEKPSLADVDVRIPGWEEAPGPKGMRGWRHPSGAALTLTFAVGELSMPSPANITILRVQCRKAAEQAGAGLIEADVVPTARGLCGRLIYKRLRKPAFVFTGMTWIPHKDGWFVWTMVEGEHGTTGVREAVVTAELLKAGALTLESYQASWAHDPYSAEYDGVDRSTLRYMSDDEKYDVRFPDHPLSHVRRVLGELITQPLAE
jgi:hypothetical protein